MSAPVAATLTLEPDNPSNCAVLDPDRKQLYTVKTEHPKSGTVTYVSNADAEVLAALHWENSLPDRVALGSAKPTSIRDWLHTSIIPFYLSHDVTFKDDSGRKYKWKGNAPGRGLELFCEDDKYAEPIARFLKSRRVNGVTEPARLLMTARGVEIRDTVVISFLFLEKGRRQNERTSQNVGDVSGAPDLGAFMGRNDRGHDLGVGS